MGDRLGILDAVGQTTFIVFCGRYFKFFFLLQFVCRVKFGVVSAVPCVKCEVCISVIMLPWRSCVLLFDWVKGAPVNEI